MELTKVAFCLFLATVALEFLPSSQIPESQVGHETVEPSPYKGQKSSSKLKGAVIIEYCQTCSYKGRVNEIKAALQELYPSLYVAEEEYPTPYPWPLLAQLLSYVRLAGLALLFAGDHVFAYLQMNYPPWYLTFKNNKIQAGIFLFFGLNLLSNWMVSNGAFEVIYDGTILYSGLKAGKLPSVDEIIILLNEIPN